MRRFIKLLSPLLLAALFISCAQSVKQNGSINLDGGKIISRAVQYSINKSRSPETKAGDEYFTPEMVEAMKEALEFKATLAMEISSEDGRYKKSAEEDYNIDYSSLTSFEKKTIKFNDVPVGIKAIINATITTKMTIKDKAALTKLFELMDMPAELADLADDLLIENLSTELNWGYTLYGKSELTVHEGENPVTLKMSYDPNGNGEGGEGGGEDIPVDGTIDIEKPVKLTITIDQEKSDSKYYLNKGKIFFILLDEDGNNLLANQENSRVDWTYKLTLRNTEIPESGASGLRYEANSSVGSFEIKDMPAAGNYQLYVQAQKFDNGTYSPSAPTSAVFDLPVENMTYYSFSVNSSDGDNYIDLGPNGGGNSNRVLLASTETDVYLKLYGETTSMISVFSGLHDFLNNSFSNKPYYFSINTSELVSTSDVNFSNYVLQDLEMLKSIVMPDCSKIYFTAIFQNCSNLEYVKFGEAASSLDVDCNGAEAHNLFLGCNRLKQVEFAKTDGWYNSDSLIGNNTTIDWNLLTPVDVSNPEINVSKIKNGTFKYLYRKTE